MQMQVNLLPVHHRPKPSVRLWPIIVTIVLTANLMLISLYWLTLNLELAGTRNDLHSVEQEILSLQRQVDEAQWKAELEVAVKNKGDYISGRLAQSILWHPAVAALERAMVPGVTFSNVQFLASGDISITGTTNKVKTVADLWGSVQAETELRIVRLSNAAPGGNFSMILRGWYGREREEEQDD